MQAGSHKLYHTLTQAIGRSVTYKLLAEALQATGRSVTTSYTQRLQAGVLHLYQLRASGRVLHLPAAGTGLHLLWYRLLAEALLTPTTSVDI